LILGKEADEVCKVNGEKIFIEMELLVNVCSLADLNKFAS